jgi:hypothetical protein
MGEVEEIEDLWVWVGADAGVRWGGVGVLAVGRGGRPKVGALHKGLALLRRGGRGGVRRPGRRGRPGAAAAEEVPSFTPWPRLWQRSSGALSCGSSFRWLS